MRCQQLFENLYDFDFSRTKEIASQKFINGGWEVWFQVEFTFYMKKLDANFQLKREVIYPGGAAARCDFMLWYGTPDQSVCQDPTYIELKCINPFVANPKQDAINRYLTDINKAIPANNTVGCILLFYGTDLDITNMPVSLGIPANELHVFRYTRPTIVNYASSMQNLLDESGAIAGNSLFVVYYERTT